MKLHDIDEITSMSYTFKNEIKLIGTDNIFLDMSNVKKTTISSFSVTTGIT